MPLAFYRWIIGFVKHRKTGRAGRKNQSSNNRKGRNQANLPSGGAERRLVYESPDWEETVLELENLWPRVLDERQDIKIMDAEVRSVLGRDDEYVLSGEVAYDMMMRLSGAIYEAARKLGGQLTYHRWLQNLRYLPAFFYGAGEFNNPESFKQRRSWSELLAATTSTAPATMLNPDMAQRVMLLDHSYLPLLRFLRLGRTYASLRILASCAAKDVPILLRSGRMPFIVESDAMWRAVRSLDSRRSEVGIVGEMAVVAGTAAVPIDPRAEPPASFLSAGLFALSNSDGRWINHELSLATGVRGAQYVYSSIQSRVPHLMKGQDWYSEKLPLLCFAATALSFYVTTANPWFNVGFQLFGQATMRRDELLDAFENWQDSEHARSLYQMFPRIDPPYSPEMVTGALCWTASLETGPPGPAAVDIGSGFVLVDLVALTDGIVANLRLDKRQSVIDIRSRHFEVESQKLIDTSSWNPRQFRRYVQKTLVLEDGRPLTDVDALAVFGDLGLFINCKSYVADAFGRAQIAEVRSLRSNLNDDYRKWDKKVQKIAASPKGRNFDFTGIREFIPIVMTPGPCLVTPDYIDFLPVGLRPITSLYELERFLFGSSVVAG